MSKRARLSDTPTMPLTAKSPPNTPDKPGSPSKTSPFTYELISKPSNENFSRRGAKPSRHTIQATLSIPADDEECPLTLDPIATSQLPCLPGTPFLQDRPLHTKLTLPCGHSFSAMTLVYAFCKNNMTCPCCRAGEEVRADTFCLPAHFRMQIKAHIQQTLEAEQALDESAAQQELMDNYNLFGVTIPYAILGMNSNLSLVANFHDIPTTGLTASTRPIFSFSAIMQPVNSSTGRVILVPRGPLRALTHIAHMGVNSIQLCMQLCMQGTGDILIDSTPITRLPDIRDPNAPMRLTIPGSSSSSLTQNNQFQVLVQLQRNQDNTPVTSFSVVFTRSAGHFVLDTITWNPGTENLEILSSNVQLAAVL